MAINSWHYIEPGNKLVSDVYRRKVTSVVQFKKKAWLGYCCWTGELDDDTYFKVQVLDAIILLTVSERPGELVTKDSLPIAYSDCIKDVFDEKNDLERAKNLIMAKSSFIPEFTSKLTFESIMEIFMWKYASSSVEVYDADFV